MPMDKKKSVKMKESGYAAKPKAKAKKKKK